MKYFLEWLYGQYQAYQGLIFLFLALLVIALVILGGIFLWYFPTIMRCIGLAYYPMTMLNAT